MSLADYPKVIRVNKIAIISHPRGFHDVLLKTLNDIDKNFGKCTLVSIGELFSLGPEPLKTIQLIKDTFDCTLLSFSVKNLLDSYPKMPLVGSPMVEENIKIIFKHWTKEVQQWLRTLPESEQVDNILFELSTKEDEVHRLSLFHELSPDQQRNIHVSLKNRQMHCVFSGIFGGMEAKIYDEKAGATRIKENFDFEPSGYGLCNTLSTMSTGLWFWEKWIYCLR